MIRWAQSLTLMLVALQASICLSWAIAGRWPNACMWFGVMLANLGGYLVQRSTP